MEEVSEVDKLDSSWLACVSDEQGGAIAHTKGNNAADQPLCSMIDPFVRKRETQKIRFLVFAGFVSQWMSDKSALIRSFCEFVD